MNLLDYELPFLGRQCGLVNLNGIDEPGSPHHLGQPPAMGLAWQGPVLVPTERPYAKPFERAVSTDEENEWD